MKLISKRSIRRAGSVIILIVGLMAGAVAFAAWTSTGTGAGTATAGSAKALTISVTNVEGLFPTGSIDLPFTVTNPNEYAVTLSKVSLDSVTVDKVGCDATVVTGDDVTVTDVIAAKATSPSHDFSVTMSNAATDACQGAVFTVTLKAAGASS